jgi:hypothetical protein
MKHKVVISRALLAAVAGFMAACLSVIVAFLLDLQLWLIALVGIAVGGIVGGIVGVLIQRVSKIKFDLERLPAPAADYIKLVIEYMRYRRTARQEVADELTDHFEQGLKDCHTEQDKQQLTQRLIDNFGDPKLLAVLVRRAKKRCRPLWRTVVARSFQTIALLIICLILYVAWFLTGKPVITTDYVAQLNKIVRPSADDSFNAAPLYLKAAEALVDVNDVAEFLRFDFYDANNNQKELMRQWLAKNETPLALVAKGSELPFCWKQYRTGNPNQGMIGVLLPDLPTFRTITYALCWRAWLNAETGDFNSAFRDIETCYRFGRHNKGEKILIEQLVGMAIEARALQTARHLLDTHKIGSDTLADFQRRLQNLIETENFRPNLLVEKLIMFDEIQRCFTESRFGPSHIYPRRLMEASEIFNPNIASSEKEWTNWLISAGVSLYWPISSITKNESIASANAYYKFSDDILSKTPAQLRAEGINMNDECNRLVKNNLVLQMLQPALGRVHIIAWRNKIDAECTPVTIALVRYKQDTDSYPDTLDKLVDRGYIRQIPIDPFSRGPLSYKKTEEGPLLYSWGENLTDDGGQVARDKKGKVKKFADEGDWVFWPVGKK